MRCPRTSANASPIQSRDLRRVLEGKYQQGARWYGYSGAIGGLRKRKRRQREDEKDGCDSAFQDRTIIKGEVGSQWQFWVQVIKALFSTAIRRGGLQIARIRNSTY
jgi:hypothetical protein